MPNLKVMISGGGTGGHIFPAIAIANAIKKKRKDTEFLFVGATGKMEMTKVPEAGFEIVGLPIMGLQRSLSLKNLKFPFKLIASLRKAKKIVKDFKPNVVIGVGGYASGPLLMAAQSAKIPTLIQEQNSYAGLTNKMLAKKANSVCVAYEGMERFFDKEKIIITGNPVREKMVAIEGKRDRALSYFELSADKKVVLVVGGSLGAWAINEAIEGSLNDYEKAGIQLIWQTGKLFYSRATKAAEGKEVWLKVQEFIQPMDLAYAAADLVVSRAGAIAVSELCIVQKPSIFVPLPTAAEDHQTKNALVLYDRKAAALIKNDVVAIELSKKVLELINDEVELLRMSELMTPMGFHDAADIIADEAIKLGLNNE